MKKKESLEEEKERIANEFHVADKSKLVKKRGVWYFDWLPAPLWNKVHQKSDCCTLDEFLRLS
jgi:hypothetical protein